MRRWKGIKDHSLQLNNSLDYSLMHNSLVVNDKFKSNLGDYSYQSPNQPQASSRLVYAMLLEFFYELFVFFYNICSPICLSYCT